MDRDTLYKRFEETANIFATLGLRAEAILGASVGYRDWMKRNLRESNGEDPQTFISWVEGSDRQQGELPHELGHGLIEDFDDALIEAVRAGMMPQEAVEVLDEWVEDSKQEAIDRGLADEEVFEEMEA
jgi:hypothetical protein